MTRWMVFVPMYNCAPQIRRTLAQILPFADQVAEVFVVDNGSTDGGTDAAKSWAAEVAGRLDVLVVRNDHNLGLGGSHKVAFQRCLDRGHDGMIVLHGDDQGRLGDLVPALAVHADAECVLGARFMRGSQLQGYAPHRILANIAFNGIFSAMTRSALWDLGSGLNAYRAAFVRRRLWEGCADDLTFNYHLLLRSTRAPGCTLAFAPISWREDDQVSNAKLARHGRAMLRIVRDWLRDADAFCATDHSTAPTPRTWTAL